MLYPPPLPTTKKSPSSSTHFQCGVWSNLASKLSKGLDPSMLFPVNFSSSMVCTFRTWNLTKHESPHPPPQQKNRYHVVIELVYEYQHRIGTAVAQRQDKGDERGPGSVGGIGACTNSCSVLDTRACFQRFMLSFHVLHHTSMIYFSYEGCDGQRYVCVLTMSM